MKLYHGTSSRFLPRINREGLKPRGRKKGNWEAHPSHPDAIYLTNSYAVFYANACAQEGDDLVVLEVDTDKLNPFLFAPDEDFLEQVGRGRDEVPGDMQARNKWYRDRLKNYVGHPFDCYDQPHDGPAAMSLQHLGNCTYFGRIQPDAISRVAVINVKQAQDFVFSCFDPSIILMNYKVCGASYRNSIKWLFGYDDLEPDPLELLRQRHAEEQGLVRPEWTRAGITIMPVAR